MKSYKLFLPNEHPNLTIRLAHYMANDSIALLLDDRDSGEPYANLTVCLPDQDVLLADEAYVDTNNCEWAEEFILENHLGEFTGQWGYSGFCKYPKYKFNLKEMGLEVES